ncbi:hypothetical protein [Serinibacter arcticus]|uniref:hypothetical protein n=1 Tax=Serinibacter arcticus TaxID=1655435 RepID=UPI0011B29E71|nr:hypothetical protein [Serinibacter arcticus]
MTTATSRAAGHADMLISRDDWDDVNAPQQWKDWLVETGRVLLLDRREPIKSSAAPPDVTRA